MIKLGDATTLALTKLRMRKVRTTITVIIASLLFSGLAGAIFVAGGVIKSAEQFTSGSLSDRYINTVYFQNEGLPYDKPEVQARANELQQQVIAEKKAAAKQLGIEYNPASEPKPVEENPGGKYLNMASLAARRAVIEYQAKQPSSKDKVKAIAEKYHPKEFFNFGKSSINGTMKPMKEGKEDFSEKDMLPGMSGTQEFTDGWSYLASSVLKPFFVEQKYLDAQKNTNDLPIIAPYSKVEKALGLESLAKTASPKEKMDRINEVREKASTVTFTACYRNSASKMQIDQAKSVAQEIEQNKNNKEYQKPSLIYGLPAAEGCVAAPVISDTRTSEDKKLAEKQLQFSRQFGEIVDPVQQKVTARVVGLGPDGFDMGNFSSVDILVSMVAGNTLQGAWVVPQEMYDAMPNKADYAKFAGKEEVSAGPQGFVTDLGQLVEFSTPEDAKAFSNEEGCAGFDCNNKPYIAFFGSNSVLLKDLTAGIAAGLSVIGLIIAGVASLILMGMVGRIISDSRRETAVFRAIGAKRTDIGAIYTIYTFFISLFIIGVTLLIGWALAFWLDRQFSAEATVKAQLTFAGVDKATEFHLFGFWWQALIALVGLILVAGFVAMIFPILRNIARSPIKDMRDDT